MAIPTFKDLKDLLGKSMTLDAQRIIIELQEQQIRDREEILKLKKGIRRNPTFYPTLYGVLGGYVKTHEVTAKSLSVANYLGFIGF